MSLKLELIIRFLNVRSIDLFNPLSTAIFFKIDGSIRTIFSQYIDIEDTKDFLFTYFFEVFCVEKEGLKNKQIFSEVIILIMIFKNGLENRIPRYQKPSF